MTNTAMSRIRDYYRIPAKRGMRIVFDGKPATITNASRNGGMHLKIRFDDGTTAHIHPTWRVEYPQNGPETAPGAPSSTSRDSQGGDDETRRA